MKIIVFIDSVCIIKHSQSFEKAKTMFFYVNFVLILIPNKIFVTQDNTSFNIIIF